MKESNYPMRITQITNKTIAMWILFHNLDGSPDTIHAVYSMLRRFYELPPNVPLHEKRIAGVQSAMANQSLCESMQVIRDAGYISLLPCSQFQSEINPVLPSLCDQG